MGSTYYKEGFTHVGYLGSNVCVHKNFVFQKRIWFSLSYINFYRSNSLFLLVQFIYIDITSQVNEISITLMPQIKSKLVVIGDLAHKYLSFTWLVFYTITRLILSTRKDPNK